ncbi:hypothetical protein C0416_01915 [bacterium]|nr:hypothetical protein [bacterium]
MLQPKFNPFFYAKFVFAFSESPEVPQANADLTDLDKVKFDQEGQSIVAACMARIRNKLGSSSIFSDSKKSLIREPGFQKDIQEKTMQGLTSFYKSEGIKNAKSVDEKKEVVRQKLEEIKELLVKLTNEFIENEQKRKDFIESIKGEKEKAVNYMVEFFESDFFTDSDREKIGKQALINVTKAIMSDVIIKNTILVEDMTNKQIKDFDLKKLEDILKKDIYDDKDSVVNTIKNKIITEWLKDTPRAIYKDKNWTENDMPDGPVGGTLKYTPILEKELKKEVALDLESRDLTHEDLLQIENILNERKRLINDFTALSGDKDDLYGYQEQINVTARSCELVDANNNYPVEWILGNWQANQLKSKYIPIMNEEITILKDAIAKLESSLISKPKEPEVIPENKKTEITGIQIDKDGVHITGANLADKAGENLQIKLPENPMRVATSDSGQTDVKFIAQGMEGLQKQVVEFVKAGISGTLAAKFTGVDFQVALGKIKDENIEAATKDQFKGLIPDIKVYGTASPDGDLKGNLDLAKERGEKAKNKILAKVPADQKNAFKDKIKVECGVQGPNGEIISTQDGLEKVEKDLIARWNTEAVGDKDKKLGDKDIKFIYDKLKSGSNNSNAEKVFIDKYFTNARGAAVKLDFPQEKQKITVAMDFKETPAAVVAAQVVPN